MQAIILAAGMGRRLGALTADNTKCMVKVNGVSLIDRMLRQLKALPIDRVVIVTGYESERLRDHVEAISPDMRPPVHFIDNPDYATTNNIHSLWMARECLSADDTLLLESDIILDDNILARLIDAKWPDVALVDKYQPWMDGTMVQIDPIEGHIISFVPKKAFRYADAGTYYKTVNVYRLSREFATRQYLPFLEAYIHAMGQNEYYEQVLRVLTMIDSSTLKALPLADGSRWYEIDDIQDLRIAEVLFSTPEERLRLLGQSYGGYWRYPALKDFCYLVNPYYPTRRMTDEMEASFPTLLRNYPSGMSVNTLLAAKFFGLSQPYTAIGNGAAELIHSLMDIAADRGRTGLILPSFEEYINRLPADSIEVMMTDATNGFRYSADDIIRRFTGTSIASLLIVNPDNPSGNFIDRDSLDRLLQWSRDCGIRLIVDESFVDFAHDSTRATLLHDDVLETYPMLTVVKSISKSYGVPGLRLGVAASADTELIDNLRHRCSIWNINSFAEYYLQIAGKYTADYERASRLISDERDRLYHRLTADIDWLTVYGSEANYFLCRLADGISAHRLAVELLDRFNILIKDCSAKRGFPDGSQYIRIAVRDTADNDALLAALATINPQTLQS